jgi:hypothetical protein
MFASLTSPQLNQVNTLTQNIQINSVPPSFEVSPVVSKFSNLWNPENGDVCMFGKSTIESGTHRNLEHSNKSSSTKL